MHDVFRLVGLVALGNQAAAAVQDLLNGFGQIGKGADGQMADQIRRGSAGNQDFATRIERGSTAGRMREENKK